MRYLVLLLLASCRTSTIEFTPYEEVIQSRNDPIITAAITEPPSTPTEPPSVPTELPLPEEVQEVVIPQTVATPPSVLVEDAAITAEPAPHCEPAPDTQEFAVWKIWLIVMVVAVLSLTWGIVCKKNSGTRVPPT